MTANEYLATLTEKSAWVFTKQDTSFDESVKAARLLEFVCNSQEDINIEEYFAKYHKDYGINTHRHRMLVIAQLFGLITKTPFYTKGIHYKKERPTEIFDLIKDKSINSPLYNQIKTEQMLKFKIHAIIDTADNNEDYFILPIIFIYKVLKDLQVKHNIKEVSLGHFYTYILTCKTYNDADNAVKFIAQNAPLSVYASKYAENSRIRAILDKNIKLFQIDSKCVRINPEFDEYFNKAFMQKYDFIELHNQLKREVDYSYFLYNHQNFCVNLIDKETKEVNLSTPNLPTFISEEEREKDYLDKVDAIKEYNVNDEVSANAYKIPPIQNQSNRALRTNPILGKISIKRAYYSCENDYTHKTFISNKTNKPYMEAHHLVPVAFQYQIWQKFHINIDCLENLVSLCPNCHKAFHYGTKEVKTQMITNLFEKIIHKYNAIGFSISIDEIKKLYGV